MNNPLWTPTPDAIRAANLFRFQQHLEQTQGQKFSDYGEMHRWSVECSEQFWTELLHFSQFITEGEITPVRQHAESMPDCRWFPNVRLNFAENLLQGPDTQIALLGLTELGAVKCLSFAELRSAVFSIACELRASGIQAGDRVVGILPNAPETVVAMLATSMLGALWASCSPDFGATAIVDRLQQIRPKLLFSSPSYTYGGKQFLLEAKLQSVLRELKTIEKVVVVDFLGEGKSLQCACETVAWENLLQRKASLNFERFPFSNPLCLLFSSGTTGIPKCLVHGTGGTLLQHYKELALHSDIRPGDVVFYYTTCGWMMWNWLLSSLALRATVVLYDGSPFFPNPNSLLTLAETWNFNIFGTSAKYLLALEKQGISRRSHSGLPSVRTILSTGSPLAPESFDFVYRELKSDLCLSSISGGSDIISCFSLGNPTLPVYRGELQCLGLGMDVQIFNDNGESVVDEAGELICARPFPSLPLGFWNDDRRDRFQASYFSRFPNVWLHGDWALKTSGDGLIIYGRSDATLNPGGVRIGTAEIYRTVEAIPAIEEALAVGQEWGNDVRIILFVILKDSFQLDENLRQEIRNLIRINCSPHHVPAKIIAVPDLPRTRNGKITELAVRNVIHGRALGNVGAISNPEALDYFSNLPELSSD